MIARLQGTIMMKAADRLVVDVAGVGYEVWVPLSTYYDLGEEGSQVTLHIYTYVKEDVLSLFGFLTPEEKSLFTLLIQISGIGPKLAVTILSGLPVSEVGLAVMEGNVVRLTGIPGVGKKTAERIILEMREKIGQHFPGLEKAASSVPGSVQGDVVSALVNLGYARSVAEKAVSGAVAAGGSDRFEVLLRASLKRLNR
jgi:Holliday junction DNA helicase RuvA